MPPFTPKLRAVGLAIAMALTSTQMLVTVGATGLTLLSGGQAEASTPIRGVTVKCGKNPRGSIIATATSDDKGMFEVSGLEPGEYFFCFAKDRSKGESCAITKVDKEGTVRGQTVFDEERKAAKHNYVGHVTLLR